MFFSGVRKEEAARLTWTQLSAARSSGSIYLPDDITKTGESRAVPVSANLAAWLDRYNKPAGLLLPERWQDADPLKQMRKLDDMGKQISRKTRALGQKRLSAQLWHVPSQAAR